MGESGDLKTAGWSGLTRFRTSLAARDWLGIAIEVAVVVLGILIAFQIDQWGDQRARARDERQLLERLHRENARSVAELREALAIHTRNANQLAAAIRARDDPTLLARYSRIEGFGCWPMQFPATAKNSAAGEELIASGRLNLINDPQLRTALRDLAASQAEASARLDLSRNIAQTFVDYLHPYYDLWLGEGPAPLCRVDWVGVMRDPAARTASVRTYRAHERMVDNRQRLLTEAQAVQNSLSCRLNKPECRPAISPPS